MMRNIIVITLSFIFSLALFSVNSQPLSKLEINKKTFQIKQTNEDIAVLIVHQAIRDNKLSSLRDHCLAYDFDEGSDKNYYIVDVREDKKYAICGGDPDTSVHLFRFKVDRQNLSLLTDAGTTDGSFYSVKK
ncbi:hypothetical protein [Erwinia pyrifoliae]|uniref:hypothetical protein n=1 Tax=Erwinia pyrifoliae TaxID=79967 RepID=UPI001CF4B9AF|nr:hypothetical protein [Erwinia pyrifoliae]UWS28741.1 hypothetical protein NYP81_12415 [Erwinia pyrifoliae]UXK11732.1 hypothetical protein NYP80_15730 [Erwinia pyrifoliae]